MERRIFKIIDNHYTSFKNDMKNWLEDKEINTEIKSEFLKFIYDYQSIKLTKDDFQKRKRIKNIVIAEERCIALRANGEQCTRRKMPNCCFCGTHVKGAPHGKIDNNNLNKINTEKRQIWVEDIKGISYFIDNKGNVYAYEDVLQNKINPSIIGSYKKKPNGEYIIPEFGIN